MASVTTVTTTVVAADGSVEQTVKHDGAVVAASRHRREPNPLEEAPRFRTWPITATARLEPWLRQMGLRVPAHLIDGTAAAAGAPRCLSDALVSVGPAGRGGTGSFVSDSGLIVTNWHVAHEALRQASLAAEVDYLKEGFVAASPSDEVSGSNYEVWITRECTDVSADVCAVLRDEPHPLRRTSAARECMNRLVAAATAKLGCRPGFRCDVREMMPNESYVLFTFEQLLDVRIVYAPPQSLGYFGGDTDNFEWPRHTADFTLLRAYTAPDGSAAPFSPNNVPYRPRSSLRFCADGASEGDFVFLLGFPGRTMRYAPSSRLTYNDTVSVPSQVAEFRRKLDLIAKHESTSREAALKMAGAKRSLSNELKRCQGKVVMMRKLGLIAERESEEAALCRAVHEARPVLAQLSEIYNEFAACAAISDALHLLSGFYHGSVLLAFGTAVTSFLDKTALPDEERAETYAKHNMSATFKRIAKRLKDVHQPHECDLVADAVAAAAEHPELAVVAEVLGNDVAGHVESALAMIGPDAIATIEAALLQGTNLDQFRQNTFVQAAVAIQGVVTAHESVTSALLSERSRLFAELAECHRRSSSETLYPDANSTLRLSAGHVEGYSAADAVVHTPGTTLGGLLDKTADALAGAVAEPSHYECPPRLLETLKQSAAARAVPTNILYSTDTVGGNSGSPVLNADGEFVGINFDRQRQGLLNEYKWSKDFSRSIGVDVRLILWLIGEYDGAKDIVGELLRR